MVECRREERATVYRDRPSRCDGRCARLGLALDQRVGRGALRWSSAVARGCPSLVECRREGRAAVYRDRPGRGGGRCARLGLALDRRVERLGRVSSTGGRNPCNSNRCSSEVGLTYSFCAALGGSRGPSDSDRRPGAGARAEVGGGCESCLHGDRGQGGGVGGAGSGRGAGGGAAAAGVGRCRRRGRGDRGARRGGLGRGRDRPGDAVGSAPPSCGWRWSSRNGRCSRRGSARVR